MKLEVKSCVVSDIVKYSFVEQDLKFVKCSRILLVSFAAARAGVATLPVPKLGEGPRCVTPARAAAKETSILPSWRIMLNAVEDLTSLCFRQYFRFDFTSRDKILFHSGTPDTTKGLGECVRCIGVPLFSEFPNCYYPLCQKPVSLVRSFCS